MKPSLVKATTWARETFRGGSIPSRDKIIKWIEQGEVPGRLIGGCPYIDENLFCVEQPTIMRNSDHQEGVTGLDLLR
jgi:hypothetical protein